MSRPDATVVVATHNRAGLLGRLVRALEHQDTDAALEVVIVDDASSDGTPAELARLAAASSLDLRTVHLDVNGGPALARNAGWRAARSERVLFTDDDCVPAPQWARLMLDALRGADMAQGMTLPDPAQAANGGPFSRTITVRRENGYYQTCNMAYRRDVLERVGGFDPRFTQSGEDTDLAWRALDQGARCTFVGDALVHHDVRPSSYRAHLRGTLRWGGVVLAVREHPHLRDRLHRRWFWKPSHPPAILAAGGLLAGLAGSGAVRGAGVLACLPYLVHRLRDAPLGTGVAAHAGYVPAALVADLLEVGVLARASIRFRTLLL